MPASSDLAQPEQPGRVERDDALSWSSTPVPGTNEDARSDSSAQETGSTEAAAPDENQRIAETQASPPELVSGVTQRAVEPPSAVREPLAGRPSTGETIRITVDWVSGEDPWANPARLEQARKALHTLEDQGVRVELVRGREVPAAQYNPREAQRATDFQMLTTAGPVLLGGVDLLDSAVLVAQRPGSLEVLLAPREFATAQPSEPYRGAPEMPLAISEEEPEAEGEPVARRETVAPVAPPRSASESETEAVRREATVPPAPSSVSEVAALPVSPTSESWVADQSENTSAEAPKLQTTTPEVVTGSEPEPRLDVLRSSEVVTPSTPTISAGRCDECLANTAGSRRGVGRNGRRRSLVFRDGDIVV